MDILPNRKDWVHNQVNVYTPGVAQPLQSAVIPDGYKLVVVAKPTNTGVIYLGRSSNEAQDATRRFDGLVPGAAKSFRLDNANKVYVDAVFAGDGVSWAAEQ